MTEQTELPMWVEHDGPESIRHRLYVAAIGAGPGGHVQIRRGLALDICDALRASEAVAVTSRRALRNEAASIRARHLVDAEQRAWCLLFLVWGFALGSGAGDVAKAAWRWLHAG